MRRLILVVLILSIPALAQLFVPGFYGASDDLHIAWLHQFNKTIFETNQFPPRYVPDLSYGFGYPLFNFVFPLPFMVGQIFYLLGISLVGSIKSIFGFSFILSSVGMFLLAKKLRFNNAISVVSSMVYLYAPYRATDVYIRGALGESLAIAIFPWLIYFSISKLNKISIPIFGLFISALILSHNISALLFMPILLILLVLSKNSKKGAISIVLGLGISSYFWIPALLDSSYMVKDTVFNPLDHFPTLRQLITPYWGYGASVPGPYDGMSFFQGYFQLILGLIGTFLILLNKDKKIYIWSLVVLLVSLFLMNHRSQLIWEKLPLIGYVQFPWRLQFLSLLALSILSILAISKLPKIILLVLLPLILLTTAYMFSPNEQLGRKDEYFIHRYIPVPVASEAYSQTKEEYLRLPRATIERPTKNLPLVSTADGNNLFDLNIINPLQVIIKTNFTTEGSLEVNRYLFPGWIVRDKEGQSVELQAGQPYGQITFRVTPGDQTYELKFEQTLRNKLLNVISLSSLLGSLFILIVGFIYNHKQNEKV